MSKVFVTSDLHFWHKNILKFCPETRPYKDVIEMNEAMIAEWNSRVGKDDIVYNLGDISFGNLEETVKVMERLNGVHHLIIGNHDQVITRNKHIFLERRKKDGNFLLASVNNYLELEMVTRDGRTTVVLFHYPIEEWNKAHFGSIHLHGHIHNTTTDKEGIYRIANVGVDNFKSVVVPLDLLISTLQNYPPLPRME